MGWTEKILKGREVAEVKYGITPTCVVVRPEVWGELREENYGDAIFELSGMMVAVADALQQPFEFKTGLGDISGNEED